MVLPPDNTTRTWQYPPIGKPRVIRRWSTLHSLDMSSYAASMPVRLKVPRPTTRTCSPRLHAPWIPKVDTSTIKIAPSKRPLRANSIRPATVSSPTGPTPACLSVCPSVCRRGAASGCHDQTASSPRGLCRTGCREGRLPTPPILGCFASRVFFFSIRRPCLPSRRRDRR